MTCVEQLIAWAGSLEGKLPPIQLNVTNVFLHTDILDKVSIKQIPADCIVRNPVPLKCIGDGACFAYAMVRLLWGWASHSNHTYYQAELKVKTVKEAFPKKFDF
jgi:hypothetical protein